MTPRPKRQDEPCDVGFDPGMTRTAEVLCWTPATDQIRAPVRRWLLDDYRRAPIILVNHDPKRALGRCLRIHQCSLGLHGVVEFAPTDAGWATWRAAERIGWSIVYTILGDGLARLHEISATWIPASKANRTLAASRVYRFTEPMWPHRVFEWATGMEAAAWQRWSDDAAQRDLVCLAVRETYRVLGRNPTVILPGTRAARGARRPWSSARRFGPAVARAR